MTLTREIIVRKAAVDDLDAVFPMIDRENWYWTKPEVASVLKKGRDHSLVAVLNDDIAGILFTLADGNFATWTHFIVKEKYRGAGIGGQLIACNLDELNRSCFETIDIIAVADKVDYYERCQFTATEEIQCYELAADKATGHGIGSGSNGCRSVDLHDLQKSGALQALEKRIDCSLRNFTGGLLYSNASPTVGYYEGNTLKGIMLTHWAPNDLELGPWFIQDITFQKAKEMLGFAAGLADGKNICISISSKNLLAKKLGESMGFTHTETLVRMVRSGEPIKAFTDNLVSIGKF